MTAQPTFTKPGGPLSANYGTSRRTFQRTQLCDMVRPGSLRERNIASRSERTATTVGDNIRAFGVQYTPKATHARLSCIVEGHSDTFTVLKSSPDDSMIA